MTVCGCTYDDSEPSGVCRKCHHREHGGLGCTADTPDPRPVSPPSELTDVDWLSTEQRKFTRENIVRHPDAPFPYRAILPLLDALDRGAPQADEGLREHEPGESHHYGPLVCSVCGQQGTIRLSIEPQTAAAAPVPAGLDVDRLARALVRVIDRKPKRVEVTYFYGDDIPVEVQREGFLRDVAAEYAGLSQLPEDAP